jgi:hypothetical protein
VATPDLSAVLGAMVDANVQFIVVGDPSTADALRLVVSRHPTNLVTLGTVLERLGSRLQTAVHAADAGPARVVDPLGTVSVVVAGGDVVLHFGGERRSLYAETLELSEVRDVAGRTVQWAPVPATIEPSAPVTARTAGRRLSALAEELGRLVERLGDVSDAGDAEHGRDDN